MKRRRILPKRSRSAVTIAELLVVTAIIAMLLALFLPATRTANEAARRNNCSNQVRQILLAALNRESNTERFPLAISGAMAANKITARGPSPMANDDGYSFLVPLLPYMEETTLYEEICAASNDFSAPLAASQFKLTNSDVENIWNRPVGLVVCPSFPGDVTATGQYSPVARPQVSNYHALVAACVAGDDHEFPDHDPMIGGVLVTKRTSQEGLHIRELTDGTSKTAMLTESREEAWGAWFSGTSVSTVAFPPEAARYASFLQQESARREIPLGLNYGSSDGSTFFWAGRKDQRRWGPSSAHAGDVVMSGFADGHVKTLNNGISADVYFRLVARGDGESADSDLW